MNYIEHGLDGCAMRRHPKGWIDDESAWLHVLATEKYMTKLSAKDR